MKPRTALLGAFLLASTACAADLFSPPKDLMEGVLFNQEYMTTADL
jgi:hypothetical protein